MEPPSKEKPKPIAIKKCDMCPYETSFSSHLKDHVKAKHDNIKDNICQECGFGFSRKSDLNKHLRKVHLLHSNGNENEDNPMIKEEIYKCDLCPYKTAYRRHLTNHVKAKHEQIKDTNCQECGSTFTTKSSLNYHIQKVHRDKLKCPHCPYEACWEGNLIKDIKAMHEKLRHPCPHCEYQKRNH